MSTCPFCRSKFHQETVTQSLQVDIFGNINREIAKIEKKLKKQKIAHRNKSKQIIILKNKLREKNSSKNKFTIPKIDSIKIDPSGEPSVKIKLNQFKVPIKIQIQTINSLFSRVVTDREAETMSDDDDGSSHVDSPAIPITQECSLTTNLAPVTTTSTPQPTSYTTVATTWTNSIPSVIVAPLHSPPSSPPITFSDPPRSPSPLLFDENSSSSNLS